ncbi:molybdate ABC transporter substrate-binding protein [Hahella sp. NBU794]|uniref:molybdate ABC transporter substrate-binding protein n=1 Tax=Hahella sp. NBU794 TaxID=3422590 RepID=UPI003D6FC2C1
MLARFTLARAIAATFIALFLAPLANAGEVLAAVSANFTSTIQALTPDFEAQTGHRLKPSFGSTGKLYAQITNGAPFEVFLAADDVRSKKAIDAGVAVEGSDFVYASGRLALWSKDPVPGEDGRQWLEINKGKLAVANPKTAPYGAAAVKTMQSLKLYEQLRPQLVFGENISQTYQFVYSGAATLGFVALSQVIAMDEAERGAYWLVPQSLYAPIRQEGVLLTKGQDNPAAVAFIDYLKSPRARSIIESFGYNVEE